MVATVSARSIDLCPRSHSEQSGLTELHQRPALVGRAVFSGEDAAPAAVEAIRTVITVGDAITPSPRFPWVRSAVLPGLQDSHVSQDDLATAVDTVVVPGLVPGTQQH
jgi:hypothetical protein